MNEFIEEEIAAIMQFKRDEEKERRDTKKDKKRKKVLKDTENIRRTRLLKWSIKTRRNWMLSATGAINDIVFLRENESMDQKLARLFWLNMKSAIWRRSCVDGSVIPI